MNKIDPESNQLIESISRLEDEKAFLSLISRVMKRSFDYYMETPRPLLLADLRAKMVKGCREHGPIPTNPQIVRQAIAEEHLDQLGWGLMLEYILGEDNGN